MAPDYLLEKDSTFCGIIRRGKLLFIVVGSKENYTEKKFPLQYCPPYPEFRDTAYDPVHFIIV